jgi:hypothetical protein
MRFGGTHDSHRATTRPPLKMDASAAGFGRKLNEAGKSSKLVEIALKRGLASALGRS